MANGELTQAGAAGVAPGRVKLSPATALPMGTVITNSGRISSTRFPGQTPGTPPFSQRDLIALDEALKAASEKALVRFSVYVGELGENAVGDARAVLAQCPEPANGALIAVAPNTHDVVVVSGLRVADRVNDRVAQLGVTAAIGSFRSGHLIDGLIAALHVVATAAVPS
ncbi:DUF5130 domain-containing protein [Gordonia sp. DT30]|uniref:DUF5130 domain-containing protein n=1 Tax=unclassified Gordonia (in: high G+C Gram-positive bacteria) TaxID=2657482 RepID=UPI003CEDA42F